MVKIEEKCKSPEKFPPHRRRRQKHFDHNFGCPLDPKIHPTPGGGGCLGGWVFQCWWVPFSMWVVTPRGVGKHWYGAPTSFQNNTPLRVQFKCPNKSLGRGCYLGIKQVARNPSPRLGQVDGINGTYAAFQEDQLFVMKRYGAFNFKIRVASHNLF
jgi:hypothetical protein